MITTNNGKTLRITTTVNEGMVDTSTENAATIAAINPLHSNYMRSVDAGGEDDKDDEDGDNKDGNQGGDNSGGDSNEKNDDGDSNNGMGDYDPDKDDSEHYIFYSDSEDIPCTACGCYYDEHHTNDYCKKKLDNGDACPEFVSHRDHCHEDCDPCKIHGPQ